MYSICVDFSHSRKHVFPLLFVVACGEISVSGSPGTAFQGGVYYLHVPLVSNAQTYSKISLTKTQTNRNANNHWQSGPCLIGLYHHSIGSEKCVQHLATPWNDLIYFTSLTNLHVSFYLFIYLSLHSLRASSLLNGWLAVRTSWTSAFTMKNCQCWIHRSRSQPTACSRVTVTWRRAFFLFDALIVSAP